MAVPDDSIMDMADNIEELYSSKIQLFNKWLGKGDTLSDELARIQAIRLAEKFAAYLEETKMVDGRYRQKDKIKAGEEMLEEFGEYKDYAIKEAVERPRESVPMPPMDQGAIEHAKKYEALAQRLGIDILRSIVPASKELVRKSLDTGDPHLNRIPLYKWDAAAASIQVPGLSLSEKVCVIKHVAAWHYA